MSPDQKLAEMGLALPDVPTPVANYMPFKRDGQVIYLSGQGPRKPDGFYHTGKVGAASPGRRPTSTPSSPASGSWRRRSSPREAWIGPRCSRCSGW